MVALVWLVLYSKLFLDVFSMRISIVVGIQADVRWHQMIFGLAQGLMALEYRFLKLNVIKRLVSVQDYGRGLLPLPSKITELGVMTDD